MKMKDMSPADGETASHEPEGAAKIMRRFSATLIWPYAQQPDIRYCYIPIIVELYQ